MSNANERAVYLLKLQRQSLRNLAACNLRDSRKWRKIDPRMADWFEGKAAAYKIASQGIQDTINTLRM